MVLMTSGSTSLWSVKEWYLVVKGGNENIYRNLDTAVNVYLDAVKAVDDDVSQSFYRTDGAGFTKTNRF